MSTTSTVAKPTKAPEKSMPVETLDNSLAHLYTHIHPFLLLSVYYVQLSSIISQPVTSLALGLLPLGILQAAYATICLPPTSGSSAPIVSKASKSGIKKKPASTKGAGSIQDKANVALLSCILSLAVGTPLIGTFLVLFGAPLTTHWSETTLCAAHMALLTSLPLVYVKGVDGASWREIGALLLPVDEVYGATLGTLIGAWLGAIPIPLDWDREWQKWPITIISGAYAGYVVGKFAGGFLFKGKKISFN